MPNTQTNALDKQITNLGSILYLFLEDYRHIEFVILNEVNSIYQSASFLSASTDYNNSEFFGGIKKSVESIKNYMVEGAHQELIMEKITFLNHEVCKDDLITLINKSSNKKNISKEYLFRIFMRILVRDKTRMAWSTYRIAYLMRSGVFKVDQLPIDLFEKRFSEWMSLALPEDKYKDIFKDNTTPQIINIIKRRFELMRKLDKSVERLRLCRKAFSERMETLRPSASVPVRFYRKEVKHNLIMIDKIFDEYANKTKEFIEDFVIENKIVPNFLHDKLLVCDHCNETFIHTYNDTHPTNIDSTPQFIIRAPYWLMEIPRYIPVLAHETAHALWDYTCDRVQRGMYKLNDPFNRLNEKLESRIDAILQEDYNSIFSGEEQMLGMAKTIKNEVLADFLSLFIAGPAYIWVLVFSIIHREGITKYLNPVFFPPPYVRIEILRQLAEIIYDKPNAQLREWLKCLEVIQTTYGEYFMHGANRNASDKISYKSKIIFYGNMVRGLGKPLIDFAVWLKKQKAYNKFKWLGEKSDSNGSINSLRQIIHDVLTDEYDKGNKVSNECYLTVEEKQRRNIPNVIWSNLMNNFGECVKHIDKTVPEGRIVRAMFDSKPAMSSKNNLDKSIIAGDYYEILLYDIFWGGFKDLNITDSVELFEQALKNGIMNYGKELAALSNYHFNSEIGKEPDDNFPHRQLLFTMFGEYDYFLIRNKYSARSYYHNWPPKPQILKVTKESIYSDDYISDKNDIITRLLRKNKKNFNEFRHSLKNILDNSYHIRRYLYQGLDLGDRIDFKESELMTNLEETFTNDHCLAFTQIECINDQKDSFLENLFENILIIENSLPDKYKRDATLKDKILGVFKSTAWDDYAICWRIPQGMESLAFILNGLIKLKEHKVFSRSVTHLVYNPDYEIREDTGVHVADNENQMTYLQASTRVTHPISTPYNYKDLKASIADLKNNLDGKQVHLSFGISDLIIRWTFKNRKPFKLLKQLINKLVEIGYLGDCSTSFMYSFEDYDKLNSDT